MYPGTWAATTPDKPALVMAGSGRTLTYAELDDRSLRLARHLQARGLARATSSRCSATTPPRPTRSTGRRCARASTSPPSTTTCPRTRRPTSSTTAAPRRWSSPAAKRRPGAGALDVDVAERLVFGAGAGPGLEGYGDYEAALAAAGTEPLAEQPHGDDFLYSSGTTGRPKGVKAQPAGDPGRRAGLHLRHDLRRPLRLRARTPSTCRRRRSTTRRRCASAASCTRLGGTW